METLWNMWKALRALLSVLWAVFGAGAIFALLVWAAYWGWKLTYGLLPW